MRSGSPDPGWALLGGSVDLLSTTTAFSPGGTPGLGVQLGAGRKPIGHMICSLHKYLLGTYYVPGTVLGTEAAAENRHAQIPEFLELT